LPVFTIILLLILGANTRIKTWTAFGGIAEGMGATGNAKSLIASAIGFEVA